MKKILYILLASVTLFTACKIGDKQTNEKRTIYGYQLVYESTYDFMISNQYAFSVLNLNSYIDAETQKEKDFIATAYFPMIKIVNQGNLYLLTYEGQIFLKVDTRGVSLSKAGSVWQVLEYWREQYPETNSLYITSNGNSWTSHYGNQPPIIFTKEMITGGYNLSFKTSKWRESFSCDNLAVKSPLVINILSYYNTFENFVPVSGIVKINGEDEHSTVECTFSSKPSFEAIVNYRGLTEIYNYFGY